MYSDLSSLYVLLHHNNRFQDGLAAFQTDYKLLTKVTEERDRLKSETIHQRKTIATSQDVSVAYNRAYYYLKVIR